MTKLSHITVHGRFQPPLHINHWKYVSQGFERADLVTILITNPYLDEAFDSAASWRSNPENNPFTYEERVEMFRDFFEAIGVPSSRYNFQPFNIKDDESFKELNYRTPNLVNVYSEWSAKKVDTFRKHKLKVIILNQSKTELVSGTIIRELIKHNTLKELPPLLVKAGIVPEAIPGLIKILRRRYGMTV